MSVIQKSPRYGKDTARNGNTAADKKYFWYVFCWLYQSENTP
jgi:hypothetical protein